MATAGIIEDRSTWREVVDPTSVENDARARLRKFLFNRPNQPLRTVKRADFLSVEITEQADNLVRDVVTVINSETLALGYLGNPGQVTDALVNYLYGRLAGMLAADDAIIELDRVRASHKSTPSAATIVEQMAAVVDDTVRINVTDVVNEAAELANQTRLLDLQIRMPQLVQERENDRAASVADVAARLSAIVDLPIGPQ